MSQPQPGQQPPPIRARAQADIPLEDKVATLQNRVDSLEQTVRALEAWAARQH